MKYTFMARGHRNILAKHKKTLEFTKDKDLSLDGDCIVGVGADFSLPLLRNLVREHGRLRMTIKAGKSADEIEFIANRKFNSSREIVLRFSEFSSDRTLGFRATKAADQIDKQLVKRMQDPDQQITVEIEPLVKAVVFDLDDTLADLKPALDHAHMKIAKLLFERYGVYGPTTVRLLNEIDALYCTKGMHAKPSAYDRRLWFEEYFKRIGVSASSKEIEELAKLYWTLVDEVLRPMPNARQVLSRLKKQYKIAVMTDSDGGKSIKMERLRRLGFSEFFDILVLGDDIGINKPDKKYYSTIFKKAGVKANQCVMVGDKPQVDLELAKEIGMTTVWMKHGNWSERQGSNHFDYVDHEITDLNQLIEVMKQL